MKKLFFWISTIIFSSLSLSACDITNFSNNSLPTPSVSVSPIPTSQHQIQPTTSTTTEIQQLREVIQQKVKEKVKEKLQNLNQTPVESNKKAYSGTITEVNTSYIKINSRNQNIQFTVNNDTSYINLKQSKIKNTDLKVGQEVLILSLKQDSSPLIARRIILIESKKLENQKVTIVGKIADISTSSSVLTLIPINNKNQELQIKIDNKTEILSFDKKTLKIADLKKGFKIICTYGSSSNSTYPALQIIKTDK